MTVDFAFFYHPHTYETQPSAQLGLGMLLLATYAKSLGASVDVINVQAMTIDQSLHHIPPARALCLYGCLVDAPIINLVGRYALASHTVEAVYVGGPIARSPECLSSGSVTKVVIGSGEEFIRSVVTYPEDPTWRGGRLVYRSREPEDINAYPFPDRSLIRGSTGGDIFRSGSSGRSTTILMSRWCRYRCAFCSSGSSSRAVQDYDLQRIEEELDHCMSLGLRDLRISDDNILNDADRFVAICGMLRERGMRWRASLRVKPADEWRYRLMVESGCEELSFGIESGDQHVLDRLRKGTRVAHNTEAVQKAKRAGIRVVRALMMMATPGETPATLELNMAWVREAAPDIVSLKVFVPYPGTDIYARPGHYGCEILQTDDFNNSSYRPDESMPRANIALPGVMTRAQLTNSLWTMRQWLEGEGRENRG